MRWLARLLSHRSPAERRPVPSTPSPAVSLSCEAWLAAWGSIWEVPDLPSRVRIAFSPRVRRSLGRCTPRRGAIRLNPGLLDAPSEALREVVCHEAAHVAAWLIHGVRARPHGREWKDLMRRAGYEPRVRWKEAAIPPSVRERRR